MKNINHAYQLGATMYMPATLSTKKMLDVIIGKTVPNLQTVVICLEDAVKENDLTFALFNLNELLNILKEQYSFQILAINVFIRPRDVEVAKLVIDWNLNDQFSGFVLPKFTLENSPEWKKIIPPELKIMPTFETQSYFDPVYQKEIRDLLTHDFPETLCLRIGGNDLMSCLNLRRPKGVTLYSTPVGTLISQLVTQFLPYGFNMSAPVCEHFSNVKLLEDELSMDMNNGLYTKTVIHPSQVAVVQNAYKVSQIEYDEATEILNHDALSVFKSEGSMLEIATHKNWAKQIILRKDIYGVQENLNLSEVV